MERLQTPIPRSMSDPMALEPRNFWSFKRELKMGLDINGLRDENARMVQAASEFSNRKNAENNAAAKAQADQRGAQVGQQQNNVTNQYADSARKQLAQGIAGTRANASSRGLLYSGLRQGDESAQRAQAASGIAANQTQTNQGGEQQLSDWNNQMGQQGMDRTQLQMQKNAAEYKDALAKRGQQQAAIGSAAQGIGSLAGAII